MHPIKVKIKQAQEVQKRSSFLHKFDRVSNSLNERGALKLFDEKERLVWINPKEKYGSKNLYYYAFDNRDFSKLNILLNRIAEKENCLRARGLKLDGIKSFNRNVWLDFSKNSNAIEGIFDDFSYDLLDLRAEIRGKFAIDPSMKVFDRNQYFKKLLAQYQKAQISDDSCIVTGKKSSHKLSMEMVGQFLALKFAYKVAKMNDGDGIGSKEELCDLIFQVAALLSGNEDVRFRVIPVYLRDSGANWLPVQFGKISEKLDALTEWATTDKISRGQLHPIEKAAIFHAEYERIHPFMDGNGRSGRILTNYLLIKDEMPTISIGYTKREEYFHSIDKAIETHDVDNLIGLFYEEALSSANKIWDCLNYIEKNKIPKERVK